eukprot:gene5694-7085_t
MLRFSSSRIVIDKLKQIALVNGFRLSVTSAIGQNHNRFYINNNRSNNHLNKSYYCTSKPITTTTTIDKQTNDTNKSVKSTILDDDIIQNEDDSKLFEEFFLKNEEFVGEDGEPLDHDSYELMISNNEMEADQFLHQQQQPQQLFEQDNEPSENIEEDSGAIYNPKNDCFAIAGRFNFKEVENELITPDDLLSNKDKKTFKWNSKESQRLYFIKIAQFLKFKSWEDWYGLYQENLIQGFYVQPILEKYQFSIMKALVTLFPNYPWDITKFLPIYNNSKKTPDFQSNFTNVRMILDYILKSSGYDSTDGWYSLANNFQFDPDSSLHRYIAFNHFSSIHKLLLIYYPEVQWDQSKFIIGQSDASIEVNFKEIEKYFGIKTADQWKDFKSKGVFSSHTLLLLEEEVLKRYPELKPWDLEWSRGWIGDKNQRLNYLKQYEKEKGITSPEMWVDLIEQGHPEGCKIKTKTLLTKDLIKLYPGVPMRRTKTEEKFKAFAPVRKILEDHVLNTLKLRSLEEAHNLYLSDFAPVLPQIEDLNILPRKPNDIVDILKILFPYSSYQPSELPVFEDPQLLRQYFINLYKNKNFTSMEDFYTLHALDYDSFGCRPRAFSTLKVLKLVFPNYGWKKYKFDMYRKRCSNDRLINVIMLETGVKRFIELANTGSSIMGKFLSNELMNRLHPFYEYYNINANLEMNNPFYFIQLYLKLVLPKDSKIFIPTTLDDPSPAYIEVKFPNSNTPIRISVSKKPEYYRMHPEMTFGQFLDKMNFLFPEHEWKFNENISEKPIQNLD